MGKKSSSGGTQTTISEPAAYLKPYLQGGLNASTQLFNTGGPQQYTGSTVVPFAPQTEQALSGITQRATNGSLLTDRASDFVLNGLARTPTTSFSTSNPYASGPNPYGGTTNPLLDQTFQHAADQSYNTLAGQYARSGRNIGASMPVQSDMLSSLAREIYAPAYENERNRQFQYGTQQLGIGAQGYESGMDRRMNDIFNQRSNQMGLLNFAQPLANQDYQDLGQLANVGAQIEGKTGQIIDDRVNRWNFEQNRPQQNLDAYLARITGNPGSVQTQTGPAQKSNPLAGALGGALGGASLGSMMAAPGATGLAAIGGPWGLIGGALLGGLLS